MSMQTALANIWCNTSGLKIVKIEGSFLFMDCKEDVSRILNGTLVFPNFLAGIAWLEHKAQYCGSRFLSRTGVDTDLEFASSMQIRANGETNWG